MKLLVKNIFIVGVTCFCTAIANCQPKEPDSLAASKIPFIANLKLKKNEKVLVYRYGHIVVKDMRADTSKLGYVRLDPKAKPRMISFPGQQAGYINEAFNNAIEPVQLLDTLFIVLRDIWFNETRTEAEMAHKLLLGTEKLVSSCFISAEFFTHNETGYRFVGNYDSVVNKKGEWLPNNCDKLLEKVAKGLLKEADDLLAISKTGNSFFTNEQFDSLLVSRFYHPVLKADKPAKGVYFSYTDFLNNNPVVKDYTVVSEKSRTIDYAGRKTGDSAWGYSDGETIYMHIGTAYYRLYKAQNTFEVIGPASVEITNSLLEKSFRVAADFYSFGGPIRYLDPTPFFEPGKYTILYYKFYRMNMKNGYLN
jgi:hypothetical protein